MVSPEGCVLAPVPETQSLILFPSTTLPVLLGQRDLLPFPAAYGFCVTDEKTRDVVSCLSR